MVLTKSRALLSALSGLIILAIFFAAGLMASNSSEWTETAVISDSFDQVNAAISGNTYWLPGPPPLA
ncbi:MAG: hypothetical protein JJD96_04610 [Thermoleophilia bacterium]|nr:hypothetical protein [Thermoleophilia bacterium]